MSFPVWDSTDGTGSDGAPGPRGFPGKRGLRGERGPRGQRTFFDFVKFPFSRTAAYFTCCFCLGRLQLVLLGQPGPQAMKEAREHLVRREGRGCPLSLVTGPYFIDCCLETSHFFAQQERRADRAKEDRRPFVPYFYFYFYFSWNSRGTAGLPGVRGDCFGWFHF